MWLRCVICCLLFVCCTPGACRSHLSLAFRWKQQSRFDLCPVKAASRSTEASEAGRRPEVRAWSIVPEVANPKATSGSVRCFQKARVADTRSNGLSVSIAVLTNAHLRKYTKIRFQADCRGVASGRHGTIFRTGRLE
jgi:hypothetical protein